MSEHRVSMLGSALRRFETPETSSDPRIRELVAQLRTVDYAPAPRELFRTELRSQLVAVAPRIIAESALTAAAAAADSGLVAARAPRRSVGSVVRSIPIARPLGVAASVITVFALLLGGAVWLSQKSLPGDALYGLKRTSENVRLSLTSGDTARGHEYLSLATTRVSEAQQLAGRTSALGSGTTADSAVSSHTAALIKSTLNSADSDLKSGSSLLGDQAVNSDSAKPLDIMKGWAPSQLNRLEDLASALPAGAVKSHALSSWNLVKSAQIRAKTLSTCGCLTTTKSDDLGPQPTATPNAPRTVRHGSGASTPAGVSPRHTSGRSTTGAGTSSTTTTKPGATPKPKTTAPGLPTITIPKITIPTLPTSKAPSLPVSVDSCGVHVSLLGLKVNVATCSTGS